MTFKFGIDQLLASPERIEALKERNIGLVAHPASVTQNLTHSLDALIAAGVSVRAAFGPQHGMRGDKQDNMIETEDYTDPTHKIPVYSLYGEHRKPTAEMLEGLDLILFDLQDIGCRIYTYITTLRYFIEACAERQLELWVLDRPNPAGRQIDGLRLLESEQSFVGADTLPTRHGLTTGELAEWFRSRLDTQFELQIIAMENYEPQTQAWPGSAAWINPSPNAASVNMTRCFPGTVLLEGTTLSEGRGTTIPLEVIGAPNLPVQKMIERLREQAPHWCEGAILRVCYFEPTFHKHLHQMCTGIQIHSAEDKAGADHFYPYRLIAGLLKVLRQIVPDYEIWRHHDYEYELDRIPIDVINGGPDLRLWVDDPKLGFDEFDARLNEEADHWRQERKSFLIY